MLAGSGVGEAVAVKLVSFGKPWNSKVKSLW
jgi:hypothetical protein